MPASIAIPRTMPIVTPAEEPTDRPLDDASSSAISSELLGVWDGVVLKLTETLGDGELAGVTEGDGSGTTDADGVGVSTAANLLDLETPRVGLALLDCRDSVGTSNRKRA
jgi:hypothetical protein